MEFLLACSISTIMHLQVSMKVLDDVSCQTLGQYHLNIQLLTQLSSGCHSHGDTGGMGGLSEHQMFWCTVGMYFAGLEHLGAALVADAELQLCVHHQAIHQDLPKQLHQTQEVTLY